MDRPTLDVLRSKYICISICNNHLNLIHQYDRRVGGPLTMVMMVIVLE